MFFEILTDSYFEDTGLGLLDGNSLAVHPIEEHRALIGKHITINSVVLYYLRARNINFEDAETKLHEYYQRLRPDCTVQIDAKWIVMGSAAGIYLFDELKDYRKAQGIRNHICTIDTDDGKTFFAPGHDKNYQISSLFEDLFAEANSIPDSEFARRFIKNMGELLPLLH